jgi:hypothetical protein
LIIVHSANSFCSLQWFLYVNPSDVTQDVCCGLRPFSDATGLHDPRPSTVSVRLTLLTFGVGSREQNYRPEDCGICHAGLTGKRGTGFWEGGKGTRDKTRMSRKGQSPSCRQLCYSKILVLEIHTDLTDPRKYKRRPATQPSTSKKS